MMTIFGSTTKDVQPCELQQLSSNLFTAAASNSTDTVQPAAQAFTEAYLTKFGLKPTTAQVQTSPKDNKTMHNIGSTNSNGEVRLTDVLQDLLENICIKPINQEK